MATWHIDPVTKKLTSSEPDATYNLTEYFAEPWPPCPVCSHPIVPKPLLAAGGGLGGGEKRYKPGHYNCDTRNCEFNRA